jgi:tetratricopeptide (TPR) repeat protein
MRRAPLTLALLVALSAAAADQPLQIGVIVTSAGQSGQAASIPSRHEYADALIAELAGSQGFAAALLHERSPLVLSRQADFPAVGPPAQWPALEPLLAELAQQLQLDYILLTCLSPPADEQAAASLHGLLVVRGGGSHRVLFDAPRADAPRLLATAARSMAQRVISAAKSRLPPPVDTSAEEPVAVQPAPAETTPTGEPTEPTPATGEPAPGQTAAYSLALAAFERGDYGAALIALRDAFEQQEPGGPLHLLRAQVYLAMHQEEEALKDLHSAVAASPDLVEARVRLGYALQMRGLWQDAARHYRAALAIDPGSTAALLGLSRVYRDNGHRRKAIQLLEQAVAAAPAPGDPKLLVALADLQAGGERPEQAEASYLRALELSSGEAAASTLERLGDLYLKLRRHRDALRCYAQAADPALAGSDRGSMVERRYREVMRAADSTVREELGETWRTLQDYLRDGLGEREQVFVRMSAYQRHLEEAIRFADGVVPPASLEAEHTRRQLAYSLALEATVAGQAYLDLGGEDLLERAQKRRADALVELDRLRTGQ